MADINHNELWDEIKRLSAEIDTLERKLAAMPPEGLAQVQVHLAVLENSLLNLQAHVDRSNQRTDSDIKRLIEEKVSHAEAKIPHLLIYAVAACVLGAALWAALAKIGLYHPPGVSPF